MTDVISSQPAPPSAPASGPHTASPAAAAAAVPHTPGPDATSGEASATTWAYVGLGSNLGDRRGHLEAALHALADLQGVDAVRASTFYDTPPLGPQDQGRFLNAAAELRTTLTPAQLLPRLLEIERRLGRPPRDQRRHWGPREIDLDLLLHGGQVIDQPGLKLPHPQLHRRDFVLRPLAELAPDLMHPVLQRSVGQLRDDLPPAGEDET